jgi:hypothetical protein
MPEFIDDLSSTRFWMTTIVLAILVNIASAFFKGLIDRTLGALSSRRTARTAQRARELDDRIAALIQHAELVAFAAAAESRCYMFALLLTVMAGVLFNVNMSSMAGVVGVLLAFLTLVLAMYMFSRGTDIGAALVRAERRRIASLSDQGGQSDTSK